MGETAIKTEAEIQGWSVERNRAADCARLAEAAAANAYNVSLEEMRARTRRKARVALARQTAMYLSHVALGVSLTRTGAYFGRDRTTASHACRVIEEKRDDPDFDLRLSRLEESLARMARMGC